MSQAVCRSKILAKSSSVMVGLPPEYLLKYISQRESVKGETVQNKQIKNRKALIQ